ncbi:MAG: M1 family aminopeptidase [Thermoanaerobaculia bacterium]
MIRRSLPFVAAILACSVPLAAITPGHHLPEGAQQTVRERSVDIRRLSGAFDINMQEQKISGQVAIDLTPLRPNLQTVLLDAAALEIEAVEVLGLQPSPDEPTILGSSIEGRQLRINLPQAAQPGEILTLRIAYSCKPNSGLYFFSDSEKGFAQAWNYGEGGIHYSWLPLYNGTNDRFAVDFRITVAEPFVALSNGVLKEVVEHANGTRTYHWVQAEEIPNYLLALNVGHFVEVQLDDARLESHSVPLSVWTEPGREDAARFAFRNTPKMVEFFAQRFGYPYSWPKYDQVLLREFDWAMETATMVGFGESEARLPDDPSDSLSLTFDRASAIWHYEDTIAHELAHHWFGNLVTCRSLASIWLNESFASFAHTLWTAEARGEDDLTYQRWRYRNAYLEYVRSTGEVRPLEFFRYDASGDMYQEETTYIKGSLVLHMLRHVAGDEVFFQALEGYLAAHAFSEVDSGDFQRTLEKETGHNLSWFFEDWIVGGGGHPSLQVSYLWVPERQEIDLTVEQVQADLPFEDLFHLPVDVEVLTAEGSETHTLQLDAWTTRVALPANSRPQAVIFDSGNWLVAEIEVARSLDELVFQLEHGDLAARLQAARQIAVDFPRQQTAVEALVAALAEENAHWGLRQEVALDLGTMGGSKATQALVSAMASQDRRVRRAAAIALGAAGEPVAAEALQRAILEDEFEEVVGVAALALGRMRAPGAADFLQEQLTRESSWGDVISIGALLGLVELEDPSLVPVFRSFTDSRYSIQARLAASEGWIRVAPEDPALAQRLREMAYDPSLTVRGDAIGKLGQLHRGEDVDFLQLIAITDPDSNLAKAASNAVELIQDFTQTGD